MACRLINDEDYLELRKVVINHKATQLMFRFNNDNPMDFTPEGEKSLLVEQMQKEFGRDAALFLKYLTFYSLKRYNEDGTPSLILKDERLANLEEIRQLYELDSNIINDPRYAIYDRPIKNKKNVVTNNMRLGTFDYLSAAMFRTNLPLRTIIRKVLNMTGGIRGINSNKVVSPQAVVLVNQALKAYYKQIINHTDDVKLIVGYGGNKLMFDSKYLDQLERARADHWNEYRRLRKLNGDGDPGLAATSSAFVRTDLEDLFESNPELANKVYQAFASASNQQTDSLSQEDLTQQAIQMYSKYLDGIFPNLDAEEISTIGSKEDLDEFQRYTKGAELLAATEDTLLPLSDAQQDRAIQWMSQTYPEVYVTVKDFLKEKGIKGNKTNIDAWISQDLSTVMINSRKGDFTQLYHEAFHRVSIGLLTNEERKALYQELRDRLGDTVVSVGVGGKRTTVVGKNLTDIQAEEYLAEQFRSYMLFGNSYNFPPKSQKQKSFFEKIVDLIRTFLGIKVKGSSFSIEEMFDMVRRGDGVLIKDRVVKPMSKDTFGLAATSITGYNYNESRSLMLKLNEMFFSNILSDLPGSKEVMYSLINKQPVNLDSDIYNNIFNDKFSRLNILNAKQRRELKRMHANHLNSMYSVDAKISDVEVEDDFETIDEDGLTSLDESEERRSESSQNFGPKNERSVIKGLNIVKKVLFAGIMSNTYLNEEIEYKDLIATFVSAISGHLNEDEIFRSLELASQLTPELAKVIERLTVLKNWAASDPKMNAVYKQIFSYFNLHINEYVSVSKSGKMFKQREILQKNSEIRGRWRANFMSKSSFRGKKLVESGMIDIDEFTNALFQILNMTNNQGKAFSQLTGIRLYNYYGNTFNLKYEGEISLFLKALQDSNLTGKQSAYKVFQMFSKAGVYSEIYDMIQGMSPTSILNKELSIKKDNVENKKVHVLGEHTGLTNLLDELNVLLSNYINNPPLFKQYFFEVMRNNGYLTSYSTEDNIVLHSYLRGTLIFKSIMSTYQSVMDNNYFVFAPEMNFTEGILTGLNDQLGQVGTPFSKLQLDQITSVHIEALMNDYFVMLRTGERERESILKITRSQENAFGDFRGGGRNRSVLHSYFEDFIGEFIKNEPTASRTRAYANAMLEYLTERYRDEVRRIIFSNVKPLSKLNDAQKLNKDKFIMLDRFIAKVLPSNNPFIVNFEQNDDSSYVIGEQFLIPEQFIKDLKREAAAITADNKEAYVRAYEELVERYVDRHVLDTLNDFRISASRIINYDIDRMYKLMAKNKNILEKNVNGQLQYFIEFKGDANNYIKRFADPNTYDLNEEGNFIIEDNRNYLRVSVEQAKTFSVLIYSLYRTSVMEGIALTFGDLSNFSKISEIYRRSETIGSTFRKLHMGLSSSALPRIDGRKDSNLKFNVFNDILALNDERAKAAADLFDKYIERQLKKLPKEAHSIFLSHVQKGKEQFIKDRTEGTDASFVISPVFYRDLLSRQQEWTDEMEVWYSFQMAVGFVKAIIYNKTAANPITFNGREITTELIKELFNVDVYIDSNTLNYEFKYKNQEIAWTDTKFRAKPLKPKGSGLQNITKESETGINNIDGVYFMLKTAMTIITPTTFSTDQQLLRFFDMVNSGIDGYGFYSAFKGTVPTTDNFDSDAKASVYSVSLSNIGLQLIEEGKERKEVVISKQMITDAIKDINQNPLLSESSKNKLRKLDDQKQELLEALLQTNTYNTFMRMGVFFDMFNNEIFIFNRKAFAKEVAKRIDTERTTDEQVRIVKETIESSDFIEVSTSSKLIQNLVASIFSQTVIDVKTPGTMLIQESDLSLGEKFDTYRYDMANRLNLPTVRVPLPSSYYPFIIKNFGGKGISQYRMFENFRKAFREYDPIIPINMRIALMNRTPLDNRHSITAVNIKDFYMPYEKYAATIPAELVISYGFDFDYDKLTFYTYKPSFSRDNSRVSFPTAKKLSPNAPVSVEELTSMAENNLQDFLGSVTNILSHFKNSKSNYPNEVKTIANDVDELIAAYVAKKQDLVKEYQSKMTTTDAIMLSTLGNDLYKQLLKDRSLAAKVDVKLLAELQKSIDDMIKSMVKKIVELQSVPNFKFPAYLLYSSSKISNALLDTFFDIYSNEDLLYSALALTTTDTVKSNALKLVDQRENPGASRWANLADPATNLQNAKIMLSGGMAIGILASVIHIGNVAQKNQKGLIIDLPVGLPLEGYNASDKIEIGKTIFGADNRFVSDMLSEVEAAALDLTKTLLPFYVGFNDQVAPVFGMLLLAASGTSGTVSIDTIQKIFGSRGVIEAFNIANAGNNSWVHISLASPAVQIQAAAMVRENLREEFAKRLGMNEARSIVKERRIRTSNEVQILSQSLAKYISAVQRNYNNSRDRDIQALLKTIQSIIGFKSVILTNAELDMSSIHPSTFADMIIDRFSTDGKFSYINNKELDGLIDYYLATQVKTAAIASILYSQARLFSDVTKNYRLISFKGRGFDQLIRLQTNMQRVESTGLVGGIQEFKQDTFLKTYESAISMFLRLISEQSFFAQALSAEQSVGLSVINKYLPFNSQFTYYQIEDAFKSYAVLSSPTGIIIDGRNLIGAEVVEQLLSVNSELMPNLLEMYEDLKATIYDNEMLYGKYGEVNPFFDYLAIYEGFAIDQAEPNPKMLTVEVSMNILNSVDFQTIKAIMDDMLNDSLISDKFSQFLNALSLVNMAINPLKTYMSLGKLLEQPYSRHVSASLQTLKRLGALEVGSDFSQKMIKEFLLSLVLNNANNPNAVTKLNDDFTNYVVETDSYQWSSLRENGLPLYLDPNAIKASPNNYLSNERFISIQVPYLNPDIKDITARLKFINVIYEMDIMLMDEYKSKVFILRGVSGIENNLFMPVTVNDDGSVNVRNKLTPYQSIEKINEGVRYALSKIEAQDEGYAPSLNRQTMFTFEARILPDNLASQFLEASKSGYSKSIIVEATDRELDFVQRMMTGNVKYFRWVDSRPLRGVIRSYAVNFKGYVELNTLDDLFNYYELANDYERNLDTVLRNTERSLREYIRSVYEGLEIGNVKYLALDVRNTNRFMGHASVSEAFSTGPNQAGMSTDFFNIGEEAVVRTAVPLIQARLYEFFKSIGFSIESSEKIISSLSSKGVSPRAVVNVFNKTLKHINEDELDIADIPEEAAHVFIELYGMNRPEIKRLYDNIENYPQWEEVVKDANKYPENYDLRAEALAKLLGRAMVNDILGENVYPVDPQGMSIMRQIWEFIKRLFTGNNATAVSEALDAMNRFIDDSVAQAKEEILEKQRNFTNPESTSLVDYPSEIRTRLVSKAAVSNQTELNGMNPTAISIESFDEIFPGKEFFTDEEKEAYLNGVAKGYIEITCKL